MTTEGQTPVRLRVEDSDLLVDHPGLLRDRAARLFFRSILGATPSDTGWRCPRRRLSPEALTLRVYDWLTAHDYDVDLDADTATASSVSRELERRRSFQRTRTAASELKQELTRFDFSSVDEALTSMGWRRELRPHQREAVAVALTAINAANFSVPGSGKTAATLAIAATHLASETVDLIVVVGPLACFDPWETETMTTLGSEVPTRRVRGTAMQRQAIYDRVNSGQLLLLSYATAAADQMALLNLFQRHNVMLVVDESHRIKRFRGGVWAPALAALSRYARVRHVLSGTPMPQSGKDLYSQLSVLWPDGQLTGHRDAFANRVDNNFDGLVADVLPFVHRTPKSALGLRPYDVEHHDVPLVGTQAEVYELIESRFRRVLADADTWRDKLDALRRGRPIRLMQAAANPDLLNAADRYYQVPRMEHSTPSLMERLANYRETEHPAKSIAALGIVRGIAAENGKVVCWSNFVANLDAFAALVEDSLDIPVHQVDGRVPAGTDSIHDDPLQQHESPGETDTREAVIHRFLATPGPAVLVTNPASCSESISLHTSCHNAIYLDRTYDCALFLQSIDRIHRLGLPPDTRVTVHVLEATLAGRQTIDGLVGQALARKTAQMQQLLEGAELSPVLLADDPAVDAEGDTEDLSALLRYLLGEAE